MDYQSVKKWNIKNPQTEEMEFKMYLITHTDGATTYVPLNPENRHYKDIQEWEAEGNTIEEAD